MKRYYDELREIAEDTAEKIKSWADLLEKEEANRRRYAEVLTADRDKMRHEHGNLSRSVTFLGKEVDRLRKERDELKESHHQGECADLRVELHDVYQRAYRAERERDEAATELSREIPRVITADELREGQEAAIVWSPDRDDRLRTQVDHVANTGEVDGGLVPGIGGLIPTSDIITIVLLADAPEPGFAEKLKSDIAAGVFDAPKPAPVTAEDIRNSEPGATFEDVNGGIYEWTGEKLFAQHWSEATCHLRHVTGKNLTRSTVAPRGTYPRRLTTADLDAAEVGSVLDHDSAPWREAVKECRNIGSSSAFPWRVGRGYTSSEALIDTGWATATLKYPEPEVTAETIRASEPGTTWEDSEGDIWEWDGENFKLHLPGKFGEGQELDFQFSRFQPFARSTVPPRGDYSAKAPQVGDTITYRHQAETLPAGSVIIDGDEDAFKKELDGAWLMAGDFEEWGYSETKPPVKLVHIGGDGA